jgi:hypothetical protein
MKFGMDVIPQQTTPTLHILISNPDHSDVTDAQVHEVEWRWWRHYQDPLHAHTFPSSTLLNLLTSDTHLYAFKKQIMVVWMLMKFGMDIMPQETNVYFFIAYI